jgi:hypothetical protein
MEVIHVSTGKRLPHFDLGRLNSEQRELWDRYFSRPLKEGEGQAIRIFSFRQACLLESTVPAVVEQRLQEVDPEDTIGQYLEDVRRGRRQR